MNTRRRITVGGVVQGVGFRPFVYATASELSLAGSVGNTGSGVVIELEGPTSALARFERRLREDPPPHAVVDSVEVTEIPTRGGSGFRIDATSAHGEGRTFASPDLGMCEDCVAEFRDPSNRRFRHPFITCTNCGPRFTIIRALPYDRDATTMSTFPMCAACAREYADPADRRFHAQTIACWDCGPILSYVGVEQTSSGEAAVEDARRQLLDGMILAVKGIGGFHLACDASNEVAVRRLRDRKRRGDKPFAVMVANVDQARELAELDPCEAHLLSGAQNPIVLLGRHSHDTLAASVAPRNRDLGVMLAYTPLHHLLLEWFGPLVMTSGNLGGEPIAFRNDDARTRLAHIADGWLEHDRDIIVPCDDSVVRVVAGVERPVRRSRGYAPMPLALPFPVSPVLAVGGDLKNTCGVADGRYAWLGQHVGDMDDLATLRAFSASVSHLQRLTHVKPEQLVADAHPGYRSSAWAREHAGDRPVRTVSHHHAHVAAVMGEHGIPSDTEVLGLAFDGTGYGTDGAVWGGEVLIADYKGFRRPAHLKYVPLAGGDAAVHRPYRMALSHLHAAGVSWDPRLDCVQACPEQEGRVLRHQLETGFGCVPTSSMGRLFDAIAAIAGVRQTVDYEAQAAIELEALARDIDSDAYAFGFRDDEDGMLVDAGPVVAAAVSDALTGRPPGVIGARFHNAVIALVVDIAEYFRARAGDMPVVVTGGVFQNPTLLSGSMRSLEARGFRVLTPRLLPANDGGLAFGQLLVGSAS